ncbi:MAG: hypothetical protein IJY71_04145 [Clostridia bacterium]|nr:hypothetical protein [Clostridia bacterium]
MKNTVKITLKYDDGKEKVTLEVDADEMEICLENDYQQRLSVASPEERATVRKYTPAEFADRLNKDERNNHQKLNRHTAGYIKNLCGDDDAVPYINPIDLVADNSAMEELEEWAELDAMRQKLYGNLPKAQADLLWEVAINQTPVADIAAREGVSFQAIYLRLETARKNAKKFFKNP